MTLICMGHSLRSPRPKSCCCPHCELCHQWRWILYVWVGYIFHHFTEMPSKTWNGKHTGVKCSYFTNRGQRSGFGLEFILYLHGPWWFCSQISIFSHQSTYKIFCVYQTLYYTAIYLGQVGCYVSWIGPISPTNGSAGWQVNSCTWLPVYWTYFLFCNHHKRQQPFMARKTNQTEDMRQGRIMWWSLVYIS